MNDNGLFGVASTILVPALFYLAKVVCPYIPRILERLLLPASPTPAMETTPRPAGNGYATATMQSVQVAAILAVDLQNVRDEFTKFRQQMDSDLSFFRTENAAVKTQNNKFQILVAQQQLQMADQQDKIIRLEHENIGHETRILELEAENAELKARIAALESNGNGGPPPGKVVALHKDKPAEDVDDEADDAKEDAA